MASRNRRQILLRLASEGRESVRRDLREVRSDVRDLAREEARVRIDVERRAAEAEIAKVEKRLENLSKQPYTAEVGIRMARTVRSLDGLERRLDRLDAREVDIDVDVRRGAFERIAAGVGSISGRVDSLGGAFSNLLRAVPVLGTTLGFAFRGVLGLAANLGQVVGSVVTSAVSNLVGMFGRLGGAAGPIGAAAGGIVQVGLSLGAMAAMAGGAVIALNAILGAVVALGAALVALVASLAAAIGGLGALAVAFGGVLAPVVLVLIGLFTRFAAILQARQAREKALEQAVSDQRTAEQQRAAALEQVREAEERLAQATIDGRREMARAIEEQADAQRSLESSKLGVKEARLGLRDARAELREFLKGAGAVGPTLNALTKKFTNIDFDPSSAGRELGAETGRGVSGDKSRELQRRILAVQRAQIGVKDAIDSVGDSERALGEARQRNNEFTRRGIAAYRPYAEALDEVRDAQGRLTRATERSSSAQESYQRELAKLSETERGTLSRLNRFIDGFTRLAKAFTDPIFRAINDVFDRLSGQTGFLERGLRLVGEALGGVVRSFGAFLAQPATRTAFGQMAQGAASLARSLGSGAFISFLEILRNIALAALPSLRSGAQRVSDVLAGWSQSTGTAEFAGRIRTLIGHLSNWLGLVKDLGRLVLVIFRGAAGAGGRLVTHIRNWVSAQADLLAQNPEKVREFFRRMVDRAREIVRQVRRIVAWLRDHLPAAAETAKEAFGALETPLRTLRAWTRLIRGDLKGAAEDFAQITPSLKGPRGSKDKSASGILKEFIFGDLFHSGGTIEGRGDVPIVAQSGEEVIRRSIASQFRPQLKALNAGVPPQIAFAGGPRTTHITAPITVPGGGSPDPRTLAALIEMELRRGGG